MVLTASTEAETGQPRVRRFPLGPAVALAVGSGLVLFAPHALAAHTYGIVCPFKALTGLDCPGCGITRACAALAHGNVLQAADHNLLFVALLPVLALSWFAWVRASVQGNPVPLPPA